MSIDWTAHNPGTVDPLPEVELAGVTMLEVCEIRATEGAHAGETLQITRAFRSWSGGRDGAFHVHAWAENEGLGFVWTVDEEGRLVDSEAPWVQYTLGAHCAALPRHDERATVRAADPTGDLDLTPLGRSPTWGE